MYRTTEIDYGNTVCDSYSQGGEGWWQKCGALSEFHTLSEGFSRRLDQHKITFFQVGMPGRVSVPRYSCCSAGLELWLYQRCLSSTSRMLLAENSSGLSCHLPRLPAWSGVWTMHTGIEHCPEVKGDGEWRV